VDTSSGVSRIAEKSLVFPSANDAVFLPESSEEKAQILDSTQLGKKDEFLTHQDTSQQTSPFSKVFEEKILENFFKDLVCSSTAGYVLYGEKPLYLNNYCNEKYACTGTKEHKEIIELCEVGDICKNFNKFDANYFLHITKQKINEYAHGSELLVINKSSLINVVNKNMSLFQYKLGVNVTAEGLIKQLVDSQETISTLFKGNPSLLGIILGYGTENAITYERGIFLKNNLYSDQSASPLHKKQSRKNIELYQKERCLPQFGYLSTKDKIEDLSKSLSEPTSDDDVRKTKIPFSYLKNSNESKNLIQMYDRVQSDINKKNSSKELLKEVLLKFTYSPKQYEALDIFSEKNFDSFPKLIARAISEKYTDDSFWTRKENFFNNFIAGIKKAETCSSCFYDDVQFFDDFRLCRLSDQKIQENTASTQQFFSTLADQHDTTCVDPNKIYYRILKSGSGPSLNLKTKKISIKYLIKNIENTIVCGSYDLNPPEVIELSCVTDGVVLGMLGMKKNEVREIFLHQDYFEESEYARTEGKALCISVELLDLEFCQNEIKLAECAPIQLYGDISKEKRDLLINRYIEFCGFRTGLHYKKASNFFSVNDLLIELCKIQNDGDEKRFLTTSEARFLRKFDLFLYYNGSEK
jgi:hypothetical protein